MQYYATSAPSLEDLGGVSSGGGLYLPPVVRSSPAPITETMAAPAPLTPAKPFLPPPAPSTGAFPVEVPQPSPGVQLAPQGAPQIAPTAERVPSSALQPVLGTQTVAPVTAPGPAPEEQLALLVLVLLGALALYVLLLEHDRR